MFVYNILPKFLRKSRSGQGRLQAAVSYREDSFWSLELAERGSCQRISTPHKAEPLREAVLRAKRLPAGGFQLCVELSLLENKRAACLRLSAQPQSEFLQ